MSEWGHWRSANWTLGRSRAVDHREGYSWVYMLMLLILFHCPVKRKERRSSCTSLDREMCPRSLRRAHRPPKWDKEAVFFCLILLAVQNMLVLRHESIELEKYCAHPNGFNTSCKAVWSSPPGPCPFRLLVQKSLAEIEKLMTKIRNLSYHL